MTNIEFVPCIPFEKSWVRGYYERRNGKMVYIRPYENSKSKQPGDGATDVQNVNTGMMHVKKPKLEGDGHQAAKPMTSPQIDSESLSWLVGVIIDCVKKIRKFEPGEIARLKTSLFLCRSIIKELGYYEPTMEQSFKVPNVSPTKLGDSAGRVVSAMAKQLSKTSRRVTKATLKDKVVRLGQQMEAAL